MISVTWQRAGDSQVPRPLQGEAALDTLCTLWLGSNGGFQEVVYFFYEGIGHWRLCGKDLYLIWVDKKLLIWFMSPASLPRVMEMTSVLPLDTLCMICNLRDHLLPGFKICCLWKREVLVFPDCGPHHIRRINWWLTGRTGHFSTRDIHCCRHV